VVVPPHHLELTAASVVTIILSGLYYLRLFFYSVVAMAVMDFSEAPIMVSRIPAAMMTTAIHDLTATDITVEVEVEITAATTMVMADQGMADQVMAVPVLEDYSEDMEAIQA
jgi:hypothetical protein